MFAAYDVFVSHAWADGDRPQQIAEALGKAGLRVWFDAAEINDFTSITRAVTEGLAQSKALLAYYSKTYPLRRACQWELTAAFIAAQAEGDPRRRVLVVSPDGNVDHIHPIELRDAKFRTAPNNDSAKLQELAQSIVKHVALLDGPLADIHPLSAPNWYGRPPVGSTRFVGRLREMWEVHSLLHAGDVAQISYAAAATGGIGRVSGLGGVGKSLLAEEYALHFGSAYPGGVFWLNAYGNGGVRVVLSPEESEALRTDQMRQMAERLGIDTHGKTAEQVEGSLARKIGGEGKACLWVVDNVPNGLDGDVLRRWFAPYPQARTLITTRSGEYGSLVKGIELSVLEPDAAYQLLTTRRVPLDGDEEAQARLLAADLGYHALALDVTASALFSSAAAKPFGGFRAKMARPERDALVLAETLADALPNGHEKSIAQTMLRSLRVLGAEGQDFMRLASVLAVAPIPASLVMAVFKEADKLSEEDAEECASRAFKQVTSASLAEIAGEKHDARAVHTLVSRTVRFQERSSPERTEALRAAAIVALLAEIAPAAEDPRLHKRVELQVAHSRQVVSIPATADEAALAGSVARYDFERGAYASAQTLCRSQYDFYRRVLGQEHPHTLGAMSHLAITLRAQDDLAGARKLQEETLGIRCRVLGPEHLDTLDSINALAVTLRVQGDLAGARKLHEETLDIRRRELGPEHPDTLGSMNNLAETLSAQGDLAGARKLHEETLEIVRRVLGPEDRQTLTAMRNLAVTLRDQGDLAGARKLQEETLGIRRRVLGPEHLDTLITMNDLWLTLSAQGDLAGARKLQEKALEILRRVLGPEDRHTLAAMNNLWLTLSAQGDLAGARKLLEETLGIQRRVLGPEHQNTLVSMGYLASTLSAQGDLAGARKLLEETLGIQCRVLGPEHQDTLTSMGYLASTLSAQGDLAGTRKLLEETLGIQRRVLGPEHPKTSISAWNLFRTLQDLGEQDSEGTVLKRDLLWLLDCDYSTLSADQRTIRMYVADAVKKVG
jgi:hypothetical protein